jgi:RNA-directed DNA polymerase
MNVALHGLEQAAGVRYQPTAGQTARTRPNSPAVVRYADDLVACCHSQRQTEQVKTQLAAWLAPRGLSFNEDKTQIVHLALLTELITAFEQVVGGAVRVSASLLA